MRTISKELLPALHSLLPVTYGMIRDGNLTVHEAVYAVALEGSRGLKGGYRPDSDIDLSLLVDPTFLAKCPDKGALLREVIEVTLANWKSACEIDTAAVFDKSKCGLVCYCVQTYHQLKCSQEKPDCLGVYKTQKGFNGFVPDIGLMIQKLFPILTIWERPLRQPPL